MATLKTKDEIKAMTQAGKEASRILKILREASRPGVTTAELNDLAENEIAKVGMKPGFKTVRGYQYAICTTPNDQVVHGLPGDYVLGSGDLVSIDLGVMNEGLHTDTAISFEVRDSGEDEINKENARFLEVGEKTLWAAIKLVKDGAKVGDISALIQDRIESAGYNIVKELTGHGVGYALHEDPLIPGFGKKGTGPTLKEGMTIAVEVIYTMGHPEVGLLPDEWTIVTQDGSLAAVFEHTLLVGKQGPVVLTQG
jgi:methionyl aminopeptidase